MNLQAPDGCEPSRPALLQDTPADVSRIHPFRAKDEGLFSQSIEQRNGIINDLRRATEINGDADAQKLVVTKFEGVEMSRDSLTEDDLAALGCKDPFKDMGETFRVPRAGEIEKTHPRLLRSFLEWMF